MAKAKPKEAPKPKDKSASLADMILEQLEELAPLIQRAARTAEGFIPNMTAATAATTLVKVRSVKDRYDTIMGPLNEIHEKLRIEVIPARFEAEDVTSLNLDSGHRVTISEKLSVSIPAENKDKAYAWLKKNKMGDLIIETVNSSTLIAAARKRIEDGMDMPESIFKVSTASITSVTKTK